MRRSITIVAIAAGVLCAGYLGAQAYSSHRFEQEVSVLVSRLDQHADWQVERDRIERGWFHSSGHIAARYQLPGGGDEGLVLDTDYEAGHGILSTSLEGSSDIDDGEARLFGERLGADAPITWDGRFETLARSLEASVRVPAFRQTFPAAAIDAPAGETDPGSRDVSIDFGGLTLRLHHADDTLGYASDLPSMALADATSRLALERLHLEGEFTGSRAAFEQRVEAAVSSMTLAREGLPPLALSGLNFQSVSTLDEHLMAKTTLALGDARAQGQSLLAGRIETTLDRIDSDAYRRLEQAWQRHAQRIEEAMRDSQNGESSAAIESDDALASALVAVLGGSPRFSLDALALRSGILDSDMKGEGELTMNGDGLAEEVEAQRGANLEEILLRRLEGRLVLDGAPTFVRLYLGLPLGDDPLKLALDDGVLDVNGRRMPLLSLESENDPPPSAE